MKRPPLKKMKPRQLTDDEVREEFLEHVRVMVRYWAKESRVTDVEEKLSGLAHSILSAIDGSAAAIPGFALVPRPHPDDKEYNRKNGENWYPEPHLEHDIAGSLHELFYKR
jgi:hypothetical protein